MGKERTYICIDLKSFYASVECVERGLDPLTTDLVVADPDRTEKTICLAITPSMKAKGIHNRCRVFEIPKNIDYIMAVPRMQKYIDYSAEIYGIYLSYFAKEDIHVYSIDEAFMDVTDYLSLYKTDAKSLTVRIMKDIYDRTGITATGGIGSNLYLCKIALDITAKHVPDHIGILDEEEYRKTLWTHTPLTDFWRIGPGTAARLARSGMLTMKDVAEADEDMLYSMFGIDAELLIDHAWGRESVTMADIKNYKPLHNCLSSGQVLSSDYDFEGTRLLVKEMADQMSLDLVAQNKVTQSVTLHLSYSPRLGMESAHGSGNLRMPTSSAKLIRECAESVFERIMDRNATIHRIGMSFNDVTKQEYRQYDLFTDFKEQDRENKMQNAMIEIKKKYGSNAILKGMNLEEGGKTIERNTQIGGHRA